MRSANNPTQTQRSMRLVHKERIQNETETMQKSRIIKDKTAEGVMFTLTIISILFVVVMFVGLYLKSAPVLEDKSLWSLISSSEWKPMKGEFGFLPFIAGTLWEIGRAHV